MREIRALLLLALAVLLCWWLTAAPDPAPAPSDWAPFHDVDGHTGCEILVGQTSLIRCADGYETTS